MQLRSSEITVGHLRPAGKTRIRARERPCHDGPVRWEQLFEDLDARWEDLARRERAAEIAEHTRAERGGVTLAHRMAADLGRPLRLRISGAGWLEGELRDVGQDWLLIQPAARAGGREVLVAHGAVAAVTGLSGRAEVREGAASRRFDLRTALRVVSRDRATVRVQDREGEELTGTVDAVLADHLDLTRHADHEPRRAGSLRGRVSIPHALLAVVRRV